ncbi:MAG: cysteine peptidase family C39 domain-containing protein, partial [bacterium]|nr:cysteine peptidase family C39 domain-containing protein [bacterium]
PSNDEGHYAVVVGLSDDYLFLNDPWNGKKFEISREEFLKRWKDSDGTHKNWLMVISENDLKLGKQFLPNK